MKKNVMLTRIQLFIYRKIYMKGFEFVTVNNAQQIVLDSKIGVCKCRSCGAAIEKQMMFNGICPYCESSDLFAGVLSDNHFYSITYQTNNKKINPDYYTSKKINILIPVFAFFLFIGIMIITGAGIVCCKHLIHLNDRAYYTKIMNESNKFLSYERMRKNAINEIIWLNELILMVTPLVIEMILRLRSIYVAVKSSKYLIKRKKPFISPGRLPTVKGKNRGLRTVTMALRLGYLVNCCFEIHDDEMVLALSKKVVKDRCPHCGASIVGAVDDHYKCSYCGNMLMGVIKPR